MADNFWASPNTDPKRAYRWLLYLNGGDLISLPNWVITKVSQPSFEVSEKEHQFINHKFYYPGRVTWTDVKFTLVDPISPDATQQLQNVLTKSGYIYPDKQLIQNMTDTISKKRAISVTSKSNSLVLTMMCALEAMLSDRLLSLVTGFWRMLG